MITTKEQVLDFIRSRPITTRLEIVRNSDIPQRTLSNYLRQLSRTGDVVRCKGRGYFKDEESHQKWLDETRPQRAWQASKARKLGVVKQPPETTNSIFDECRHSPFMHRVLSVYGRLS